MPSNFAKVLCLFATQRNFGMNTTLPEIKKIFKQIGLRLSEINFKKVYP